MQLGIWAPFARYLFGKRIFVEDTQRIQNHFSKGLRDGVPIGLGYLSVSVTFGVMAVAAGLPVWAAVLISMTNLTSAGQFAGLSLITGGAPLFEMALTQFVVNIRYSLMSLSLSQKLSGGIRTIDRIFLSFSIRMKFLPWPACRRRARSGGAISGALRSFPTLAGRAGRSSERRQPCCCRIGSPQPSALQSMGCFSPSSCRPQSITGRCSV